MVQGNEIVEFGFLESCNRHANNEDKLNVLNIFIDKDFSLIFEGDS